MIEYKNDGKQKEQSHEGRVTLTGSSADFWWTAEISAYGPNKAHVDMHLREGLDEQIAKLSEVRASLDLANVKNEPRPRREGA